MPKFQLLFINIIFFLLIAFSSGYAQTNEQITLTTYYPSPQGSYVELRSRRLALGDNYLSPAAFCWPPTACANAINGNADLVVEGRVGIGTITPTGALAVNSPVAIMGAMTIFDEAPGSGDVNLTGGTDSLFTWFNSGNPVTGATYFRSTAVDPILYLKNDGAIGIGTASPVALSKLTVTAPANSTLVVQSGVGASASLDFYRDNWNTWSIGNRQTVSGQDFHIEEPDEPPATRTRFAILGGIGNVGIGVEIPTYQLQISTDSAGKPNGGSWANSSDSRLKKDIIDIDNPLKLMLELRGRQFCWINPEEHGGLKNSRFGFIAQETEGIFPDWVSETEPQGKDRELVKNGKVKSMGIFGFEALTVEAIRQLKAENDALKERIKVLEDKIK